MFTGRECLIEHCNLKRTLEIFLQNFSKNIYLNAYFRRNPLQTKNTVNIYNTFQRMAEECSNQFVGFVWEPSICRNFQRNRFVNMLFPYVPDSQHINFQYKRNFSIQCVHSVIVESEVKENFENCLYSIQSTSFRNFIAGITWAGSSYK